jgi:hypothetical protein
MGSKPKQKQEQVNRRCSWAIWCILASTVVMSGCTGAAGLPLGDDQHEAATLDVDASWAKARHMPETLFGVFFEVHAFCL